LLALSISQGVAILHEPIGCIPPGDHPVVKADIAPGLDVRSAKVYFRAESYPKFYYVGMSEEAGTLTSVLPRPSSETARIVYYIEAVDTTFTSVVGPEHVLEVRADCVEKEPHPSEEPLAPREIVVGAVEAGMPALPPGFQTAGIIGTIASTGVLTGLGGGSGIGTAVVVSGLAAAGASGAVAAATASGNEEPPAPGERDEPSSPAPPATPPSSPTPPPEDPPPSTPSDPPPTPPTPPAPPPPPSSVEACFTSSFPGRSCNLKLDARCSQGSIVSWDWKIDAPAALGGSTAHTGQTVNRNFPKCGGETVRVSLTVTGGGGARSSTSQTLQLPVTLAHSFEPPLPCAITSLLSPSGSRGTVIFDSVRTDAVEGTMPSTHLLRAGAGERELEGYLVASAGEGLWSFDLSHCESLEPGSLAPLEGAIVTSESFRIAFRLEGAPGERIRLRYRLSR
jgi:hypothetical protein